MSKLKYNISLALLACSSLTFAGSMGDAMANSPHLTGLLDWVVVITLFS